MKQVNQLEFEEVIKNGYTLVDFFATWCGPCKMLSPILEELDGEFADVDFVKVDVDDENALAAKFGIMSIPTVYLFKDGEVIAKTGGFQPKAQMKKFIEAAINK